MRLVSNRDKKPEALWIGSNVGKNEEFLTHTHTQKLNDQNTSQGPCFFGFQLTPLAF